MSHQELEDFFHEFGHLMHDQLTIAKYAVMAGTGVQTDFVETPSQAMENMAWIREVLRRISQHAVTGEKMPYEMIDALIASREYMSSYEYALMIARSVADLAIHAGVPKDITGKFNRAYREVTGSRLPRGNNPLATFEHVMSSGYASVYYSYLWSEVLAEDMFSVFRASGALSRRTGAKFRSLVLAPGFTRTADEIMTSFLGRSRVHLKPFFDRLRGKSPR